MSIITYQMRRDNGSESRFEVDVERPARMSEQNSETHPEWALLTNNQCPNWPFSSKEFRR